VVPVGTNAAQNLERLSYPFNKKEEPTILIQEWFPFFPLIEKDISKRGSVTGFSAFDYLFHQTILLGSYSRAKAENSRIYLVQDYGNS
jgi:hypothetical protein